MGLSLQPCPFSVPIGGCRALYRDEKAFDRVCGQFQSTVQAARAAFSKPLPQLNTLRCPSELNGAGKSIICQEDIYLRELVRYIHLNPLRAKVVSNITGLNRYKYCSHSALMGKRQCPGQDKRYVLSSFGKGLSRGRDNYYAYVKDGQAQGRRPELVGGGLIRSLGGWAEARRVRLKGQDRMKGDERILGDGDFVMNILSEADERMDRRYELKSLGYDLDKVEQRVLEIYQIEREELYSKGRQRIRAEARGLFCYWAVRELGYGQADLGRRLGMTQPGVGYAVRRGEHIVKENNFLIEK